MPSRFCRVCAAEGIKLTNMGRGGNSCGKKLATCVPEIDLYLVEDPLICKTCSQMVDVAYTLREVCLRNEKHLTVKSLQNVLRVIKRPTKKGIAVYTDDDAVVCISDDEYNNVTGNKPELTVAKHHNVHVETANINCCSSSFYCSICDKSFLGEDSLDLHHKKFHVATKNSNIETEVVTTNEIIAKKVDDPNRVPLYEIKPKRKTTLLDDVSVKKTIIEYKDYEVVDGAEVFDKYVEMRNYPSKETQTNKLSKNKISSTDKELDVEVNSICDVCGESFAPCDLESHSLTHLKNVCQLCDKTFASNIELEKHAELHFTKCCGTKFQTGCAMQLHTYHKHGKSCGICKECFDTFKALFQHLLVHADEKLDLRCIDCNATFKDEKQHKAHLCGNFVCEQCGASWQTELELENHRKEHVADSIPNQGRKSDITESATPLQLNESKDDEDRPQLQTWTCDDCKKVFKTLMQLTEHNCLNYNCQYCGFLCRSKYIYNTHLLMHNNDKDFPCDLCSNKFISKHALISHVKTHYSELCQLCNQGFKSAKLLTRHYTSVHCKMLNVALVDYKKHGLLQVRKPSEKYMCGACKSEYSTLSNFHAHVRHSHEYCEVCKRTISRIDYMVQHIKWHYGRAMPKEPLSCPTPTTSNQPMPELRLQITNTAYFCEICQIEFQDQMKYVHHVQDMHTQRDTYTSFCQICQLHFEVENKYFDHMKIVHRQCHICQKSFNNNLLLLSHIKTHDISPNKTCPVCGKKFLNEARLHKHLNCHNKKTGFVVCFVCKKRCKNMHRLMCHFRTHLDNNVKCSFCDKHFKTTSNCNLHIRLVHGRCTIEGGSVNDDDDESVPVEELANETVASCVICKDKFENMDVLMKHIRSHIDLYVVEEPLICITCSYMVDVAYNLREMCLKNEKRFSVASNIRKKIGNNTTNVIQKSQEPEYLEPEYLDDCIEDVNRHLTDLDNDIIVICDETPQNTVEAKRSGDIKKVHNSYLENSNTIHDQESLFCRMCNKFFRRKITLISHITSFHRLKYFEPQYETESTEVEFGQRKRCKINPKIDETAEIKFTGNVKPKIRGTRKKVIYKCQNCTETFEGEKIFDKHSQSCKSNEIQKLNAECQNVKPKIRGTRKKAIYKCQNCTETFEGEKIFDKHSQSCKSNEIQKPNADSQNDKIIAAESLVISAENQCASDTLIDFMSSSKTFVIKNELSANPEPCSATCCGIEFQMGSLLQLHTYKTHGKSCGICNENFSSFNALFYHLLTHSAETPALQCTDCEVMFETKEQLRGHRCLRYKCDMCGVTCRSKLRFDSHMKTHQKLATYQCDKCEMGFTTKFSFTRHYQSIHKQVPSNVSAQKTTASVKSVKCEDCHRSFQSNEYIRNHKCISYTCKDCGMTLMSKYRFERHIIKHNTTKTEVCHICNKLFTARSTLVRHMRIHQDNQCQLCNELCVSSQVLTNHYLKQHCNNMSVCLIDYKKHGVYDLKIKGQNVQLNNFNNSINKIRTNTVRSFCYFCNKDFLTAKLFFKHVRSIHSYCKVCQTELNSGKTMVRHIYRHYQQFYNSMNELTVDPEVLTKCTNSKPNKRSKKPKQAKELKECVTYSCDFCTFKDTDKTTFDYHVLNHDQSATDMLMVDPKVLTNYANSKPNKLSKKPKQAKELKDSVTYSCDVCTFKAADKTTFDDHVLNHDQSATDVLKVDQEVLTNANSKSNKRLNKPKQAKKLKECVTYSCGVCTFKDTDKTAFDDHVLNHDQNATDIIYCRFGEFEFSDDAYIDHLTIMHRRCFICKQGFQSNPELKKHKQTHVLTGSFIIECPTNKKCEYSEEPNCDNLSLPTCSNQSSNVESLKANIEQCSMTCKFCNKMFESEVECKEHVEAIHCTSSDCDVNQENDHAQIQEEKEV